MYLYIRPFACACWNCLSEMNGFVVFRLAHHKCKSFMFRLSRLSSVFCLSCIRPRKLREIGAKFRCLYRKSGSPSKNMTSDLAPEVDKYPKSSPNPHNFGSVRAYCFASIAMQLVEFRNIFCFASSFENIPAAKTRQDTVLHRPRLWCIL